MGRGPYETCVNFHRRTGEKPRYHTFYDLKVQSNQFANVAQTLEVKKGDRVLVILQSIPEWYIALIGMFKLGVGRDARNRAAHIKGHRIPSEPL